MAEEKKDLKDGGEKTTKEVDLSKKKPTGSGTGDQKPEEKVEVSKSELEQLRKDAGLKENYRQGIIRINKARGLILPGSETEEPPTKKEEEELDEFGEPIKKKKTEEFVTKKELAKMEEKKAIAEACKNDEIAENWVDIVVFYVPPKDASYETKLEAIQKAHKLWRADKGLTDKPADDQGKKDTAELAGDKGLNKGKEKTDQQPEKKSILPKKEKMTDWYK